MKSLLPGNEIYLNHKEHLRVREILDDRSDTFDEKVKKINAIVKKAMKRYEQEQNLAVVKTDLGPEWYSLRSMLGYDWAIFLMLLGGREAGKSYAVTKFYVSQWREYGRPFYWMRLTERSQRKLLQNNAEKLIDPDIRRDFNLDIVTNGENVYEVLKRTKPDKNGHTKVIEKRLMARVLCLSAFYNDKGTGLFDKNFLDDPNMYYNICLDEMNREKNEKNTFDIVYAFTNQLENLVRSTKKRVRVICVGNTLEEASDLLCAFNFIPEKFGRYKLHKKRCVIDYIEPSEAYKKRRAGTIADILMPDASTFTNEVHTDTSLVYSGRLRKPSYVIKFTKDRSTWFTVWDNNVISTYNGERCSVIAMRPYLDELYNVDLMNNIVTVFDSRSFLFRNLLSFKRFQKEMTLLKPRQ